MKYIGKIIRYLFLAVALLLAALFIYVMIPPQQIPVSPKDYKYWPGMNELDRERIAREQLSKMSLQEKVDQLHGNLSLLHLAKWAIRWKVLGKRDVVYAGYNPRLSIPPIAFTDGPRGVGVGKATVFPVPMARAASWDRSLEGRVGEAMGREARALGANYHAGACINLLRHPAWGRAQETYGEDPWLLGSFGGAMVTGVQRHNVMECVKHYALNSLEDQRYTVDVKVDERTLREVYLPHFAWAIRAGAASVMSAYNKVNGEYCGENRYLLEDILRKELGFKGFVSSDWFFGVHDAERSVHAGMDIEMPTGRFYRDLPKLVAAGRVDEARIDTMVLRILMTKARFMTRPDGMAYTPDLPACPAHTELALEVAEESMVLLRNENGLLPIDKGKARQIAVIGSLAMAPNLGDHASSDVPAPYAVTPLEGIRNYVGASAKVVYHPGDNPEKAAEVARQADVVIVVAGYAHNDEGENMGIKKKNPGENPWGRGGDRLSLNLKEKEEKLILAVAEANPKTAVVLISGSAVLMENWKEKVQAILMAWYPGMEGGNALARILFGEVNPSGKLPLTIPRSASQLPGFDVAGDTIRYGYYHGYTLLDKKNEEPAFPFGFGLSYTHFTYDSLEVLTPEVGTNGFVEAAVKLTNNGTRDGAEVVQLYIGFARSAIDRPVKLLRGFEKIKLKAGESRRLTFTIPVANLAWYNPEQKQWEVEQMPYEVYIGASSAKKDLLQGAFTVRAGQ